MWSEMSISVIIFDIAVINLMLMDEYVVYDTG